MQNQYSLMQREEEREMFPLLADQGVGSIPWSPLAKGRLTRPWGEHTKRADTDPMQRRFFAARIVGATRTRHLSDAAAALDVQLTDDQVRQLEEPCTPRMPTGY